MSDPLFSPFWYRVRDLRPSLRPSVSLSRQQFRGETWFVLRDAANERFHRLSQVAERVLARLDGTRTVDDLWKEVSESLGDDAPSQDAIIRLLAQLHSAEALRTDVPADSAELFDRYLERQDKERRSRLLSPLSIRIPLVDPQRALDATIPAIRPFFARWGRAIWLAVVSCAVVVGIAEWDRFGAGLLDAVLTSQGLIVLWLLFPVVKLLHELGHAWAIRVLGGEVHEMGVMLLVLTPVPYVDASASWSFRSKWDRALVGAAGMLVEVFVASLALFVWALAEPGLVRAIAYNVVLIAGISTLLFNANPLLRFDGYYIAQDLLELPNLRQRANEYTRYVFERYALGRPGAISAESTRAERAWLFSFSVASFAYRAFVMAAILLFLLDLSLVLGVLLGSLTLGMWLVLPAARGFHRVFTSTELAPVRARAVAVTAGGVALALLAAMLVPLPLRTGAEGFVRLPDRAFVRAAGDGFVKQAYGSPSAAVAVGTPLVQLVDPEIEARRAVAEASVRELEARLSIVFDEDRAAAKRVEQQLAVEQERLARIEERITQMVVRSQAEGEFVPVAGRDWRGRFVRQGQLLGYVVDRRSLRVRVAVPQAEAALLSSTRRISARTSEDPERVLPARLLRVVPAATDELPSAALGSHAGGDLPVDPRDESGTRSLTAFFEVDLEILATDVNVNPGGKVHVLFDHGSAPIASQAWRGLRQLFLGRFHV